MICICNNTTRKNWLYFINNGVLVFPPSTYALSPPKKSMVCIRTFIGPRGQLVIAHKPSKDNVPARDKARGMIRVQTNNGGAENGQLLKII